MARFFLFISGAILVLSAFFFGKGVFFGTDKTPAAIQSVSQNAPEDPAREISRESGTTTPPKKIAPILFVPAKQTEPLAPKKNASIVTVPLVHYTAEQKQPNTLRSSEVVAWTNTYRAQNNIRTLSRNSKLDAAAIIKVHDMFDRQYFEHISPTGKSPADLISGVGYEYLWEGENLALGIFSDEKDLADAWMASPGHRANILNSHFEEIGVGVDEGTYEGKHVWIAVQEFGKPASSCPTPEVSVKTEIERNRKRIDELSAQANELIAELNALKNENDAAAYNQKVSEYNALVAELNPLVQKTKSLIDMYNTEINEYNACIGS
jgi:uncharacterized protein YkwD